MPSPLRPVLPTRQAPSGSDFLQLRIEQAPAGGRADWLARQLREAIAQGQLPMGSTLPASRHLAAELRVSRGVVTEAYQRLIDDGHLAGRGRRGTVVIGGARLNRPAGLDRPGSRSNRSSTPTGDPTIDVDRSGRLSGPPLAGFAESGRSTPAPAAPGRPARSATAPHPSPARTTPCSTPCGPRRPESTSPLAHRTCRPSRGPAGCGPSGPSSPTVRRCVRVPGPEGCSCVPAIDRGLARA